jgi:dTMP kinase
MRKERLLEMKQSLKNESDHKAGKFITFEGIDGSGKSTQIQLLSNKLKEKEIQHYLTREPTDSPIGSFIHQIMTGRVKTDNKVIAALFVADRLDHLLNETDGISAMILNGITVITDRYYFSSYAYHGVDLSMDWVISANEQSKIIQKPTVNIFIDISPEVAIKRISKNRFRKELFEEENRLTQVREKYLEAFEKEADENVIIIDGNRSANEVEQDIWNRLKGYFMQGDVVQ